MSSRNFKFDSSRSSSKGNDDSMDEEVDDKGVVKRKSRNLSEKKRRDQFNLLINELCSMVCTGKRKADKSTILKSAIAFIQNHNLVVQSQSSELQEDWKPSFLSNEEFTHLMLEAFDGFIMVLSVSGKILYVSENITSLLGHIPSDLIGTNINSLVWDEEREQVKLLLKSWATREAEHTASGRGENLISFGFHLRRGGRNPDTQDAKSLDYELVIFSGYYRNQGNSDSISGSRASVSSWTDDSKSTASDVLSQHSGLVFVGSGTLQTPQLVVEMSLVDVSKSEFTSRHSLEWKFLFLDHRAPPIIGYLPFEVLGTSGYDYYHVDDLEKVSACHEALMQKGEGTSCCYRFLTKGQQWIWLQTRYYITYHQWNSKPEFVVCSHRVVSYSEVIGHGPKDSVNVSANKSGSVSPPDSPAETSTVHTSSSKSRNREKSTNHKSKTSDRTESDPGTRNASSSKSYVMGREKSRSSGRSSSNHQDPRSKTTRSGTAVDRMPPPPSAPASTESHLMQTGRTLRGSSSGEGRGAMSDGASVSSSSSFQSAASQHSRMSDQSMQSLQSAQSHHSLQSAESHHSAKMVSSHHQQHQRSSASEQQLYSQLRSATNSSHRRNEIQLVETIPPLGSEVVHQFLQPTHNSSQRRGSEASVSSGTEAFAYPSVLPLGVDGSTIQGVTLPVQHVLEGLPVVTLPGIVAHEPVTMTTAQRQLHEQLLQKHALLQRQILAQQEELRKVSEQLLIAQYGAWSPTVLKMTVPFTEAAEAVPVTTAALQQQAHAVLSTGGLVTCLTAAQPVTVGQAQVTAAGTSLAFTPATPLIVQNDHVLRRAAAAQETLVQLSSQDVQMLLTQTLLQDPGSSSGDFT